MTAVKELLRANEDGTISFGDYTLSSKTKKEGFEFEGDIYKVKTFSEITTACSSMNRSRELR